MFFSSPNKGLDFTLDAFGALRRQMPDLRLVVGNPGYRADRTAARAGVQFLGAQPQARMHAEVRSALCTFFPNFVIPETFGLVFAESHALGTPVLTHDCGAALAKSSATAQQVLPLTAPCAPLRGHFSDDCPPAGGVPPARLAAAAGTVRCATWSASQAWRRARGRRPRPMPRFRLSAVTAQWRALLSD